MVITYTIRAFTESTVDTYMYYSVLIIPVFPIMLVYACMATPYLINLKSDCISVDLMYRFSDTA